MQDFLIEDLYVGQRAYFSHTFTEADVGRFAAISGDYNPLHMDDTYSASTPFGKCLVHGMLVASLFSQLVGMHLPGKHCLYLGQTLQFKNPVFIDDTIEVMGVVDSISMSTHIISLSVSIMRDSTVLITGQAKVQLI